MTKESRQKIIDAHIDEHGYFEVTHFVAVVSGDPEHPAHEAICPEGWREKAERAFLDSQVRTFIQGLRIPVRVEMLDRPEPITVEAPSLIADTRQPYGAHETRYVTPAADNYMDVLDARAEKELGEWAEKYRAVLMDPKRLRQMVALVRRVVKGIRAA